MSNVRSNRPRNLNQALDFLVLGLTFYLTCWFLSVDRGGHLLAQTVLYATILVVSVRLAKNWLPTRLKFLTGITRQLAGNAAGILIGTCVMLAVDEVLVSGGGTIVALVFSGVMAFFILGTLSPIINNNKSSSAS